MIITLCNQTINIKRGADNKYGIESIKYAAVSIANAWKNLKNRLSDGKLSWVEAIFTGTELAGVGREVIADLNDLKNEVLDLTEAEIKDLVLFISKQVGISELQASVFIEKILVETITIVFSAVAIYNAAKEVL